MLFKGEKMGKFSFLCFFAVLLAGCFSDNKAQAEQIAKIQAQLDEQERQNHLLQAQMAQKEEERLREEELRKEKEVEQVQTLNSQKAQFSNPKPQTQARVDTLQTSTNNTAQPSTQVTKTDKPALKFSEKPVRYPATIITNSGYGELSLRGEPSTKGIQVTSVYDGTEVQVIAETNRCETVGKVSGCWYKVDIDGARGYMFSGYLQRELISQAEREALLYQNTDDEYQSDY